MINHWNNLVTTMEVSPPLSNIHVRFIFLFPITIMTVFEKKKIIVAIFWAVVGWRHAEVTVVSFLAFSSTMERTLETTHSLWELL